MKLWVCIVALCCMQVSLAEYLYPWRNLSPLQLGEIHCGPDMSLYYGRGDRESKPYLYEDNIRVHEKESERRKRWATGH